MTSEKKSASPNNICKTHFLSIAFNKLSNTTQGNVK